MADRDLIGEFARDLSCRLGGHSSGLATEVHGHLTESVEVLVAAGAAHEDAVREAIAAFGAPDELAAAFRAHGVGLPTRFTRHAGRAILAAAVLIATAIAAFTVAQIIELRSGWASSPELLFASGSIAVTLALAGCAVGVMGLARRVGAVSAPSVLGSGLVAVASVGALLSWFLWGWGTPLALGLALILPRVHRAHIAPRLATTLVGAGALVAGGTPWIPIVFGGSASDALESVTLRLVVAIGLATLASGLWMVGTFMLRDGTEGAPITG